MAGGAGTNGDSAAVAEAAGLTYVTDEEAPGYARRRQGKGFSYRNPDGRVVDAETRARLEALAVPPSWTDVWIAVDPDAHIQATGRDDRDRSARRRFLLLRAQARTVSLDGDAEGHQDQDDHGDFQRTHRYFHLVNPAPDADLGPERIARTGPN